jgi:hypothetical protein
VKALRNRIQRDERGASLILAIVFMLVAGAIGAGLTTTIASGVSDSASLARTRNQEYAADGGIDFAITKVRSLAPASIGLIGCGGPYSPSPDLNATPIRVDCAPAPEVTPGLTVRHNVIFVACVDANPSQPCDDANGKSPAIIHAQINFQVSGTPPAVTRTYVQTWSVHA